MDTLGNVQLECENMAASILSGNMLPCNYTLIRVVLASLVVPEQLPTSYAFDLIKKKCFDKMGLLKEKEIKDYYYGKNPEMFQFFEMAKVECMALKPMFEIASIASGQNHFVEDYNKINNLNDVSEMMQFGSTIPAEYSDTQQQKETAAKLGILQSKLNTLTGLYGSAGPRIKEDKFKQKNVIEMKQFLLQLQQDILKYGLDPILLMTVFQEMGILNSSIPPNELDPGKIDIMQNLYDVLCHPGDYYSYCRQEKIVDPAVGRSFFECCPEYFKDFSIMFLEDYDSMDYQEQINFQKCFDAVQDNSQTIGLLAPIFTILAQTQGNAK